ncbi:MAG TPA: inositol monophosphatase family protein [Acidimicrobiales bacterium]|nr:inositol monophosphatase family protein [Acidimicrobiales bacterium]
MSSTDEQLLELAVDLAHAAGRLLLDGQARVRTLVETKSTRTDMVTEMDRASEALIVNGIRKARPHDALLGEEGTAAPGVSGVQWVVDPLDGTTNYLYGFPSWAVSIGAEVDGVPAVGVVHDPVHAETFTAVRGGGAFLNGARLGPVDGAPDLATALVGTGFSYDAARRRRQAEELALVLPAVRDVRRAGSAASDMCWVAAGRLDAYYERGTQPWDTAAGTVVCTEAGALVDRLDDGTIVVAPPQLFDGLCALLAAATGPGRAG